MKQKLCSTTVSRISSRKMAFTISTGAVDRDGDTIDPKGWDLTNYVRSPVVLWAHDHSQLPVAKSTRIWPTPTGLRAEVEFPPRGLYPFADTVHDMVKAGFVNSTSVGFRPIESRPNRTGGQDFTKQELLEFSIVSVPANPQALVVSRGANAVAMRKWLAQPSFDGIDWDNINRSQDTEEVDLSGLELPSSDVNVSEEDVYRVLAACAPALQAGVVSGLRVMARQAATSAINRMTGRLD